MISSNDLKPGLTIQQDGELYIVLDASQNKTARSAMVVKAKVRNLRNGANVELSWGGGEKIQPAQIDRKCSISMMPMMLWSSWTMRHMSRSRSLRITSNGNASS